MFLVQQRSPARLTLARCSTWDQASRVAVALLSWGVAVRISDDHDKIEGTDAW